MNNNFNLINVDIDQPRNQWLLNKRKYKFTWLISSGYILHLNYLQSMIFAKKLPPEYDICQESREHWMFNKKYIISVAIIQNQSSINK